MSQRNYLPPAPLSYAQIIKRSFRLYLAGLKKALIFSTLLTLVLFSPRILSFITGYDIYFSSGLLDPERILLLLLDVVSLVLFIAVFWHYYCVARGLHEPLAEDLSKGVKKVLRVFIAGIIQAIFVVILIALNLLAQYSLYNNELIFSDSSYSLLFTVCFLIVTSFLTFYVSTLFIFQVPLIVVENRGVFSALARSARLVWNHWLRTISVQMTPWLIYLLFLLITADLFGLKYHFYFVREESISIMASLIQMISFILLLPWVATLLIMQMKDLEIRNHLTK